MTKTIKNIISLFLFLLFFTYNLTAQYIFDWELGYGGDKKDNAECIIQTFDGNLLVAGNTTRKSSHPWLVMLSNEGKRLWGKTYENNYNSSVESLIQTSDSNFIICGDYAKSIFNSQKEGFIMKIDRKGKPIWRKIFGKQGPDYFKDIIEINSGGYMAVGCSYSDELEQLGSWVVRFDVDGNKINETFYNEFDKDMPSSIIQTADKEFVISGYSMFGQEKVIRVFKIDIEGNVIWDLEYDDHYYREAHDVIVFDDHSLIVVGTTKIEGRVTDFDVFIMKLDAYGEILWTKNYGYGEWEEATSVAKTFDGNFVITGFSKPQRSEFSNFLIKKIDTAGSVLWQDIRETKSIDYANSIQETKDNGLVVAGSTIGAGKAGDFAVLKYRDSYSTEIKFLNAKNDTSISTNKNYLSNISIRSYANIKNADIIVNGILQIHDEGNINLISNSDYKYPINANLLLQEGINRVKVIVTDQRGDIVAREKYIYYIPNDDLNW